MSFLLLLLSQACPRTVYKLGAYLAVFHVQVSEIEVKAAQLLRLIESLEEYMIQETIKKLTKDLNLAFAERGREETALPTDLWKRPVSYVTNK